MFVPTFNDMLYLWSDSFSRLALQAYGLMRDTACLPDPATNTFCFLNAVRNPNPTDLYYYQLPIGIGIPKTADPMCSPCTGRVLDLYAKALGDPTRADSLIALQKTYEPAAALAIKSCGTAYATAIANGGMVPNFSVWTMGMVMFPGCALLLLSP